jgi:hypothetical protein
MPPSSPSAPVSLGVFSRPALVAGHPGHELKVFGWMSQHAPRVYLVTDGSGRHGVSRTPSTAAVIAGLQAPPGEVFGFLSDAEIYDAMLQKDVPLFIGLVDELAGSFVRHQIDFVAGDAAEGFNPTHDLCRALINAAVLIAEGTLGRRIANFEFCLTEWEQGCRAQTHDSRCQHFILDDRLLAQKLAAAEAYVELEAEVQRAVAQRGKEFFRVECLRRVVAPVLAHPDDKPLYELWGEQRVVEGQYKSVIRFNEHILPIVEAILHHASCTSVETPSALPRVWDRAV